MNNRQLIPLIMIAALATGWYTGARADEALPDTAPAFFAGNEELRGYLLEAAENHPLLKAHYEDWRAALERIPQAGALEDPMFTYTQFIVTDESYFMVDLEQTLPWFGTRAVRKEKAAAEAEYWLAHLHEQRNAVFREVKMAYFDYAFLMEELKLVGHQAGIMAESVEVARAQYESGWSSEAEVLRMEQELAKMNNMRSELEQMEPASRAALNAALNRPQDGALDAPQAAEFPPEPPTEEPLEAAVKNNNPSLRMFDHTLDAEEKDVELARRMKYPDITLGVDYALDRNMRAARTDPFEPGRLQTYRDLGMIAAGREEFTGGTAIDLYETFKFKETERGVTDELTVSIGINLPIWKKKIRAGVAEKEHMANATRWHQEDEQRMLATEARENSFQWNDATRRMALYGEDLLKREETILEGLQAEYASGSEAISILEMLDSMRNVMEFKLEHLRATKDKHQAAAILEYLIGAPW
jgi:cobalt-zinc-cadmium efflux system outer membrane protein